MANIAGTKKSYSSTHLRFEEFVPSSGWSEDSNSHHLIIHLPGFKSDEVRLHIDQLGSLVARGEREVNENKNIRFDHPFKMPENSNIEDITAKFEDEILYINIPKKATAEKEHLEITNSPEAVLENQQHNALDKDEILHQENRQNALDKEENVHEGTQQNALDKDNNFDRGDDSQESESEGFGLHSHDEMSDEEEEEEEEFHDAKLECQQNSQYNLLGKLGKELRRNKGTIITVVLAFSLGVLVSQKLQSNEK